MKYVNADILALYSLYKDCLSDQDTIDKHPELKKTIQAIQKVAKAVRKGDFSALERDQKRTENESEENQPPAPKVVFPDGMCECLAKISLLRSKRFRSQVCKSWNDEAGCFDSCRCRIAPIKCLV